MGSSTILALGRAVTAIERYDGLAGGDEGALDAYLACFHDDVRMSSTVGGVILTTRGVGELRQALESNAASRLSQQHLDTRIVSAGPDRVVAHYTFELSQHGARLMTVEAETTFSVHGELITSMDVRDREPGDRPVWAPIGPVPSYAGHIAARWGQGFLAQLYDGRAVALPVPAESMDTWQIGDPVLVYFRGTEPRGWYLPERQFGVDLRGLQAA